MKKVSKLTKRLVFTLSGIVLCMLLAFHYSDKISAKENQGDGNHENFGVFNSVSNSNEKIDNAYEVVYSVELKIAEEKIPFEILPIQKNVQMGQSKLAVRKFQLIPN